MTVAYRIRAFFKQQKHVKEKHSRFLNRKLMRKARSHAAVDIVLEYKRSRN